MFKCRFVYYFLCFFILAYFNKINAEAQKLKKCERNFFNNTGSANYCPYGEYCNKNQFCSKCAKPFDNWDKRLQAEKKKVAPVIDFITNSYKTTPFIKELRTLHEQVNNNFVTLNRDVSKIENEVNKEVLATTENYDNLLEKFNITKEMIKTFKTPELENKLISIRKKLTEILNDGDILKEVEPVNIKELDKIYNELNRVIDELHTLKSMGNYDNLLSILDVLETDIILIETILPDDPKNTSSMCIANYKDNLLKGNKDLEELIKAILELSNIFQEDSSTIEESKNLAVQASKLRANANKTKSLVHNIIIKINQFDKDLAFLEDLLKRFNAFKDNNEILDKYLHENKELVRRLEIELDEYEKIRKEHEIYLENKKMADHILSDLREILKSNVDISNWQKLNSLIKQVKEAQKTFEEKLRT